MATERDESYVTPAWAFRLCFVSVSLCLCGKYLSIYEDCYLER